MMMPFITGSVPHGGPCTESVSVPLEAEGAAPASTTPR
jgi:hypothetical protein